MLANRRFRAAQAHSFEIEPLESRRMLAGTVSADVFGSTLLIVGDAADNEIVIEQVAGQVQLTGENSTTIHLTDDVSGVRTLEIRMGDGADRIEVNNVVLDRDLIAGGADALTVEINDSSFRRLNLRDDQAEIDISIQNTQFSQGARIEAGAGDFSADVDHATVGRYFNIDRPTDGGAIGFGDIDIRDSTLATLKIIDDYSRNNVRVERSTIGTNFTLETGRNFLALDIIDTEIGRALKVTDAHGFADIEIVGGTTVGGTTTITNNGVGTTDVQIVDSTLKNTIFRSNFGDSTLTVAGTTLINGKLTYEARDGHSALGMGDSALVTGALLHRNRGGFDAQTLIAQQAKVGGTVTVQNTEGVSDVRIIDDTMIGNFKGSGSTRETNVEYANRDGEALLADIHVPKSEGPHAAVVTIHGGYWRSGSKTNMNARAKQLADRGYVVMNINYRLAPDDKFPAQIHDVHSAIMWLKDNAATYNVDPTRVGVYGYSAGAHLALLAGLTATADGLDGPDVGLADPSVKAIVAGAPGTDFRDQPLNATRFEYFLGGTRAEIPEVYEAASPAAHVDGADPPTFVFAGENDSVISLAKAEQLTDDLAGVGVESDYYVVAGKNHLTAARDREAMMRSMRFLDSHVK